MRTIRLKVKDEVYDKLVWLLDKFSKEELEIVLDDEPATPFKGDPAQFRNTQSEYDEIERNLEIALKKYKRP